MVVISAGLEKMQQADVDALKKHRQQGGSVFMMIPSATAPKMSHELAALLLKYGITQVKYDAVI